MKTEMKTALVAIEDASLETVAGGNGYPVEIKKLDLDLDFSFNYQKNDIDFSHNNVQAVGPAVFQFTQQNVNGSAS